MGRVEWSDASGTIKNFASEASFYVVASRADGVGESPECVSAQAATRNVDQFFLSDKGLCRTESC